MNNEIKNKIEEEYNASEDKVAFIKELKDWIFNTLSLHNKMPVDNVMWVKLERVIANDYNPNSVAKQEMNLLFNSIDHDGYTQPVVTVYDKEKDLYVIVDGFHRYLVLKTSQELQDRTLGYIPIVVIDKDINDRMASTVRHNRARGKHSVAGMSNMVFDMLDNGWKDEDICNELGMEPEELLKLKHLTGFSKLFKDVEYKKSWLSRQQIELLKKEKNEHTEN